MRFRLYLRFNMSYTFDAVDPQTDGSQGPEAPFNSDDPPEADDEELRCREMVQEGTMPREEAGAILENLTEIPSVGNRSEFIKHPCGRQIHVAGNCRKK